MPLPSWPNVPPACLAVTVVLEEKIPATTSSRDDHTQGMVTSSALGLTGREGGEGGGGRRGAKRSRPPAPPQSERNFCAYGHTSGNGRRPLGVSNILCPVYSTDSSPVAAAVHTSASSQNSFVSKPRRPRIRGSAASAAAAAACARPRASCTRAAAVALLLAATVGLSTATATTAVVGGSGFGTTAAAGATTTSSRLCSPADDSRAYVTTIAPDDILGDGDNGESDDDLSLPRATFGGGGGAGDGGEGGGVMGARVLAQSLRSAGAKGDVVVLVPLERATEANLETLRRDGLKVLVVPRAPQQQTGERA